MALSIIGTAKTNSSYYAGKAVQEQKVMNSGSSWSMLRTTQFHEFTQQIVQRGTVAGVQFVPAMRSQPIAAAEIAAELIRIGEGPPRGWNPTSPAPGKRTCPNLSAVTLGNREETPGVTVPGTIGKVMRDGGLLPASGTRLGTQTFGQWLAALTALGNLP